MKAVGYFKNLPINHEEALLDIEIPVPSAQGRDLLIEVKAVSVNPVDTKIRKGVAPAANEAKIIGWDAAGIVKSVGSEASLFKVGDTVWYAGSIARSGSNSEYQLVDERIVGRMPSNISFSEAAALPLTSITAWELLFDRLEVERNNSAKKLLIIGASGGVGSVLVQLAKQLTQLTIIGTASRPESQAWVKEIGAHYVIDHTQPFSEQLSQLGLSEIDYVISLNQTDQHFAQIVEVIKPQGKFALIDDPKPFDVLALKKKSVSLHWELMFTRSLFNTTDMIKQHELLNEVAKLVEARLLKTTLNHQLGKINAENLKKAHAMIEGNQVIGKITLAGF